MGNIALLIIWLILINNFDNSKNKRDNLLTYDNHKKKHLAKYISETYPDCEDNVKLIMYYFYDRVWWNTSSDWKSNILYIYLNKKKGKSRCESKRRYTCWKSEEKMTFDFQICEYDG